MRLLGRAGVEEIASDRDLVWPSAAGAVVSPLHDEAVNLPQRAPELYDALALVDTIRVGRAREREIESLLDGPVFVGGASWQREGSRRTPR